MKFLADESVDQQIVDRLRFDGHEVWYVTEMEPGISDDIVLDRANQEMAILLTADKDFGELVFRLKRISKGVILTRLAGLSPSQKAEIISIAVNRHLPELENAFAVIVPGSIRIRRSDY
jgi:predicted nuclease of predicted toxin-antitoxin system